MVTILIVDDNAVFRQVLKDLLQSSVRDIALEEAGSADEALQRASELLPALILSDIRLQKGSGLDLASKVKNLSRDVRVIILTDYDSPEYREAALEAGADNFLSKRWSSTREIVDAVKSALAGNTAPLQG